MNKGGTTELIRPLKGWISFFRFLGGDAMTQGCIIKVIIQEFFYEKSYNKSTE